MTEQEELDQLRAFGDGLVETIQRDYNRQATEEGDRFERPSALIFVRDDEGPIALALVGHDNDVSGYPLNAMSMGVNGFDATVLISVCEAYFKVFDPEEFEHLEIKKGDLAKEYASDPFSDTQQALIIQVSKRSPRLHLLGVVPFEWESAPVHILWGEAGWSEPTREDDANSIIYSVIDEAFDRAINRPERIDEVLEEVGRDAADFTTKAVIERRIEESKVVLLEGGDVWRQ